MSAPAGATATTGLPGGASASNQALPDIHGFAAGLQGAWTATKQRDLLEAQTDGTRLANLKAVAELPYAGSQAAATYNNLVEQREKLAAEVRTLSSQFDYNEASKAKLIQDKDFSAQLQPLLLQLQAVDLASKKYGLPLQATEADFFSTPLGRDIFAAQQADKTGAFGGWIDRMRSMIQGTAKTPTFNQVLESASSATGNQQ